MSKKSKLQVRMEARVRVLKEAAQGYREAAERQTLLAEAAEGEAVSLQTLIDAEDAPEGIPEEGSSAAGGEAFGSDAGWTTSPIEPADD